MSGDPKNGAWHGQEQKFAEREGAIKKEWEGVQKKEDYWSP